MRRRLLLPLAPRLAALPPPPRNRCLPLPSLQELGDGVVPLLNIAEASYNIEMAHTEISGGQGMVYLCR